MGSLKNIFWLGVKEIRSLLSDTVMVIFVVYAFTLAIQVQATGTSSEVQNASIAFVDEDQSALSKEIFKRVLPAAIPVPGVHRRQRRAGRDGSRPVHVRRLDPAAARARPPCRSQSFRTGEHRRDGHAAGRPRAGYIRAITNDRISSFLGRTEESGPKPVQLVVRRLFQPERRVVLVQERRGHHQPESAC